MVLRSKTDGMPVMTAPIVEATHASLRPRRLSRRAKHLLHRDRRNMLEADVADQISKGATTDSEKCTTTPRNSPEKDWAVGSAIIWRKRDRLLVGRSLADSCCRRATHR